MEKQWGDPSHQEEEEDSENSDNPAAQIRRIDVEIEKLIVIISLLPKSMSSPTQYFVWERWEVIQTQLE